jgi:hypothetical protein
VAAATQPSRPRAARSGITKARFGAQPPPALLFSSLTRVGAESAMDLHSPSGPAAPCGSAGSSYLMAVCGGRDDSVGRLALAWLCVSLLRMLVLVHVPDESYV